MKNYSKSLFESIKESLNKNKSEGNSAFKDFLKLEKGKTYLVRLVPNMSEPEKTFFHYYSHTWQSREDQSIVNVFCPNTYGDRCPIDEYRSKIWKKGVKSEQEEIKPLKRTEQWLVNVYVIKDPTNPENQGEVKILRYGKQLAKIIDDAISGDDSDEFGDKIFDLSKNGCNLRIKVEENEGGFSTYVASRFQSPSEIEDLSDPDSVYEKINTFESIFNQQSYDEIANVFKKHWLCLKNETKVEDSEDSEVEDSEVEDKKPSKNKSKVSANEVVDVEDELDQLLKDL
jgi:hypothetical protein